MIRFAAMRTGSVWAAGIALALALPVVSNAHPLEFKAARGADMVGVGGTGIRSTIKSMGVGGTGLRAISLPGVGGTGIRATVKSLGVGGTGIRSARR